MGRALTGVAALLESLMGRAQRHLRKDSVLEAADHGVGIEHLLAPALALDQEGERLEVKDARRPTVLDSRMPHAVGPHADGVLRDRAGLGLRSQLAHEGNDLVDAVRQAEALQGLEQDAVGCFVEQVVLEDPVHHILLVKYAAKRNQTTTKRTQISKRSRIISQSNDVVPCHR